MARPPHQYAGVVGAFYMQVKKSEGMVTSFPGTGVGYTFLLSGRNNKAATPILYCIYGQSIDMHNVILTLVNHV